MKIESIEIENFKAVRKLQMDGLGEVVVVAGPNGCGKSCVLDAIRFVKAAYTAYRQQDEWQHFFNEFQLNINNPDEVRRLFYDRDKPIGISIEISLANSEIEFLRRAPHKTIRELLRKQVGTRFRRGQHEPNQEIEEFTNEDAKKLIEGLNQPSHTARLTLDPTLVPDAEPNAVLQVAFSITDPAIGTFDYHSAHRTYQRQRFGGSINVNIQETAERLAQHALFNWQNKYTDIKNELAAAYIRDLFIKEAGGSDTHTTSILETMRELFTLFLPGKEFDGPRPGTKGELTFPVKLAGAGEHDIDDLSSGEKELVYGYLRLRNVAPTNSIILLDEPELHLNPRLVFGLPNFYRKHLGLELNNQLWMTTHSDAFLRDAYKGEGFTIFHMSSPTSVRAEENQAVPISADDEVNRAIVDLVGDIAGYRPGNKVVIFESSENASFDATMTKRLFPEFGEKINALSGDNKSGVRQLYAALNKAVTQMDLPFDVYAICDMDAEPEERPKGTQVFNWDVYHIENYLLNEKYIAKVLSDHPTHVDQLSIAQIEKALKQCAKDTLRSLVEHRMRVRIHGAFSKCLDWYFDPSIQDPALGLSQAVSQVSEKIRAKAAQDFSSGELKKMKEEIERTLKISLGTKKWRSEFRGRDILQRFAGRHFKGLPYTSFRDEIIARMRDDEFRPPGMAAVIQKIMPG